ncbi:HTH-type transcriptional regulator HdfR [Paraburkholderia caffeinitolerans]|uniref:HTH-type transcriptional regulator HdfR n=1 Tax=Paraburkholderia caffeinitolerans TaxID=1723730 RepID=A0A6J5FMW8_9BURK|nr:LysR family transcriptional regulator [Paraburkholderia caffeinitolerans]CAB3783649.1 HTH-type transcriptional regulator HdfR [Paraburkholderia caffeinitolerans]
MDDTDLPNLACLYAVLRVAEMGSVSRAATALFRAQSAITRAVQQIETALDAPLFERKPSGMLATPVGRAVLKRSERVFAELNELAGWCAMRQSRKRATAVGGLPAYLLNTRRLQLFSTLARYRHMPSAARALNVTQPAVSSAVRILEIGAGFPLFHRHPRGLLLTTDGETFLLHVRRALNELRHVADDVAALHGSVQGVVTVGALPLGRTLILPEAVARVVTRFPKVRVITDESAYEALVAGVRAGDIDFILGALRANDATSGLENEKLMSENLVILARRDHPLAGVKDLSIKNLGDAQWVLPRSHSPTRRLFETLFRRAKIKPPMPTVETADLAVIRGLLLHTDMIAVLSAQQLHYECASGILAVLDVSMRDTARDIGLTTRTGSPPSPAAHELINAIRLVSTEIARTPRPQ